MAASRASEACGMSDERSHWVALLGHADKPTDGVEDYCRLLAAALERQGITLELRRVAWEDAGWWLNGSARKWWR
jgi:hypothetical protein